MSEWQPIETAPKPTEGDAPLMLLCDEDGQITIGWWDHSIGETWEFSVKESTPDRQVRVRQSVDWSCWATHGDIGEPTHWMPLPEPPQ